MDSLNFTYCSQEYGLNLSTQTLRNKVTGKILSIGQLRELGLIGAVRKCLEEAERTKVYELISGHLFDNLK